MADDLEHLIQRIKQEGVARAEADADAIRSAAKSEAERILSDARAQAAALRADAEKQARTFAERANQAVKQAARDVLLSVHEAIGDTMKRLVEAGVAETLSQDTLRQLLVTVIEAYCNRDGQCQDLDLLVSPEDQKKLVNFFLQRFREAIDKGVEIHADNAITAGFKVSIRDGHVFHDFTVPQIAEALSRFLRPQIADIVQAAAAEAGAMK